MTINKKLFPKVFIPIIVIF